MDSSEPLLGRKGEPKLDPLPAAAEPAPADPADPEKGIPDAPEGTPQLGARPEDYDLGVPVGTTPGMDFWTALYGRRSIRKFKPEPVPRERIEQVMHAGIWAPSSCNYQMWDLVAVDDPEVNGRLAALSTQMGNAPVNIVISYGRDFSEEGSANIQSASALIQNMSLAAHVLGLGTFWITQMGDAEKVREEVGLPYDRLVIAVLAVGWPKVTPRSGPKRRPLATVSHWNHYAGQPIPSSVDPRDWAPELLTIYQRARVLNGLRHNKPRVWETRAVREMLDQLVPDGREKPTKGQTRSLRWLDVLPCTGIVTERMALDRPGYAFDVVERSPDVGEFVAARTTPRAGTFLWPASSEQPAAEPEEDTYDVVSCTYRLEDLHPEDRARLAERMARWVKPGGMVLIAFVQQRSFHDATERLRRRRGGLKGVEYVLSPDPNIGPFEALPAAEVERTFAALGLELEASHGAQAVPQPEEIEFRARNFAPRNQRVAAFLGRTLARLEKLPGIERAFGRFQFRRFRRPG